MITWLDLFIHLFGYSHSGRMDEMLHVVVLSWNIIHSATDVHVCARKHAVYSESQCLVCK